MPKFFVRRKEVHHSIHEVEAETPQDALKVVQEGEEDNEVSFEYSHTLDVDQWDVEDENGKTLI